MNLVMGENNKVTADPQNNLNRWKITKLANRRRPTWAELYYQD